MVRRVLRLVEGGKTARVMSIRPLETRNHQPGSERRRDTSARQASDEEEGRTEPSSDEQREENHCSKWKRISNCEPDTTIPSRHPDIRDGTYDEERVSESFYRRRQIDRIAE